MYKTARNNKGPMLDQSTGPHVRRVAPERLPGGDSNLALPFLQLAQTRTKIRRSIWWSIACLSRESVLTGRTLSRGGGGRAGGALEEGSEDARAAYLIDASGPIPDIRAGTGSREGGACSRRLVLVWGFAW